MSDTKHITEEARFNIWLEEQRTEGLVDIKLYPEVSKVASTEDFYAELNDMNYAFAADRFEKITDL